MKAGKKKSIYLCKIIEDGNYRRKKEARQWLSANGVGKREGMQGALREVWGMMKLLFILIMKIFSPVYKHVKMDHIVFKYMQFYTSIKM